MSIFSKNKGSSHSMGRRVKADPQDQKGSSTSGAPTTSVSFPTGIFGIVLLLGLSAVAGWYWMNSLRVQNISYSGQHFVTNQELDQKVQLPENAHPDSIDFLKLIGQVESIPYVDQAEVNVTANGTLEIHIRERQPLALLANDKHKTYVDEEGIKLDIRKGKAVNVPVLYGFSVQPSTDTLRSPEFQKTAQFLSAVRRHEFANATISEVAWTPEDGIVAMSHENGVKLVFGTEGFDQRLSHWQAFYSQVVQHKGITRMQTVDLRFEGQIVTQEQDRTS